MISKYFPQERYALPASTVLDAEVVRTFAWREIFRRMVRRLYVLNPEHSNFCCWFSVFTKYSPNRNFFAGELGRFNIPMDTPLKTRSGRPRPPRLNTIAIIDAVGERTIRPGNTLKGKRELICRSHHAPNAYVGGDQGTTYKLT
jgi:hypothetical protein